MICLVISGRGYLTIEIQCLPEEVPVRGNAMASGDPAFDREVEQSIIDDLEWNPWAWCTICVIVRWRGFEGRDYLGACSYGSKQDFIDAGGYYPCMVDEALGWMNEQIQITVDALIDRIESGEESPEEV